MGLFKNIFKGDKEAPSKLTNNSWIKWITLNKMEQLEEIKESSKVNSVLIFKHSKRCGISRMVIKQFENLFTEKEQNLKVYYLDLLSYRNLSDEIAKEFQVQHQSPQLIVIKNEHTVFNTSHYDITQINLSRFV